MGAALTAAPAIRRSLERADRMAAPQLGSMEH
jgi:hypothetical protein